MSVSQVISGLRDQRLHRRNYGCTCTFVDGSFTSPRWSAGGEFGVNGNDWDTTVQ